MKFKKEKELQAAVKKAIETRYKSHVWYFHPRCFGQKDAVDIVLCFYGFFVAIELKRNLKEKGLTKIQDYTMKLIKNSGGLTIVADNVQDVLLELELIRPVFSN